MIFFCKNDLKNMSSVFGSPLYIYTHTLTLKLTRARAHTHTHTHIHTGGRADKEQRGRECTSSGVPQRQSQGHTQPDLIHKTLTLTLNPNPNPKP
jgi:hypothetical protein